jgi:hypothetical protein
MFAISLRKFSEGNLWMIVGVAALPAADHANDGGRHHRRFPRFSKAAFTPFTMLTLIKFWWTLRKGRGREA